jgi:hypothetical protein
MARTEVERWFVKRGVPHFIKGYSAAEDVLTRAVPMLTLAFLLSAVSAIDLDWPTWAKLAAGLGGVALLVTVWAVINRMRGRPPLARPDRVGRVELAVFLFVPTALPLLFGGDVAGAALTLGGLIVVLAVVYAATSYGLVAIAVWAIGRLAHTVLQTLRLFARSLPLLLLGFMFLFINAEAWQSAGRLDLALLVAVVILFGVLAAVFLLTQIPRELSGLNRFESPSELRDIAGNAPLPPVVDAATPPPLTRRESGNLWLVMFVSQAFRLILVSSLVGVFFVFLGLLIIRPDTVLLWTSRVPTELWSFELFGQEILFSSELLRVSGFLAAFAGVYFSVYTTTDPTLRSEFFEDIAGEIRQNLAVRAVYRHG